MTELVSWPRPLFKPGGGVPRLFYKLHGDFREMPPVSRSKHRCGGMPEGLETYIVSREDDPQFFEFGLHGDFTTDVSPALLEAAARAPQALVLKGDLGDLDTLDYFRDVIGLCTAMLDGGAVGVFDPLILTWWTPADWRERVFEPAAAMPRNHVVILVSEEDEDPSRAWVHTRGMGKFGRPDLSIHDVTPALMPAVEDLCNRFIEMLASGAVIGDGQPIRVEGLPPWKCFHGGDLDDPDFNNVHLELREA